MQRCSLIGQHSRQAWIAPQQGHAALQGQHHNPCLVLEQPVGGTPVVHGQQLLAQALQGCITPAAVGEVHHPTGTGGKNHLSGQRRLEQHIPAGPGRFSPLGAIPEQHHPGAHTHRQQRSGALLTLLFQKAACLNAELLLQRWRLDQLQLIRRQRRQPSIVEGQKIAATLVLVIGLRGLRLLPGPGPGGWQLIRPGLGDDSSSRTKLGWLRALAAGSHQPETRSRRQLQQAATTALSAKTHCAHTSDATADASS